MPTAVALNDTGRGWFPRLIDRLEGVGGVRYFRVDSVDDEAVYGASGLPGLGDAYSVSAPFVQAVQREVVAREGGYRSIVRVEYGDQSSQPPDDTAAAGDAYTEVGGSTRTVAIREDIADPANAIPETQITVHRVALTVVAYRANVTWVGAWADIIAVGDTGRPGLNNATVMLPGVRPLTSATISAAAKTLLPVGLAQRPVRDGLVEVRYTFEHGPATLFTAKSRQEDAAGEPVGPVVTSDVYPTVAYNVSALWG